MHFSIKTLLAFTGFVAISICGLLYANAMWAATYITATFVLILAGIVAAFLKTEASRAFWLGFVVFGGGYFAMSILTNESHVEVQGDVWANSRLVTSFVIVGLEPFIGPAQRASLLEQSLRQQYFQATSVLKQQDLLKAWRNNRSGRFELRHFLQVGHSIFTLLFAIIGGWLGTWFYRRQEQCSV